MSLPYNTYMRFILLVMDSVGIGAAPDAGKYGDEGSNTLGHIAQSVAGLNLPVMQSMGLGNIPNLLPNGIRIMGVTAKEQPIAAYGAMQEQSEGKDTTTGHWEMTGILLDPGFRLFPHDHPSFSAELISEFERRTGRKVIGNKAASGVAIINELGPEQEKTGSWIVYTSGDSVFQIAANEQVIPLKELYEGCATARELCNPLRVGRVIARPYIGSTGSYTRTDNRQDFSYPLPERMILNFLYDRGIDVVTVGKIDDIFNHQAISKAYHVENTPSAMECLDKALLDFKDGFIFANFIDFDMKYGHRRDPAGYAAALSATDNYLKGFIRRLKSDDVLVITADHGNDPTFRGTDHTREYVPLLVYGRDMAGKCLGIRQGFFDIAQSATAFFNIPPIKRGVSFI